MLSHPCKSLPDTPKIELASIDVFGPAKAKAFYKRVHESLAMKLDENVLCKAEQVVREATITKACAAMITTFVTKESRTAIRAELQKEVKELRLAGLKEKEVLPPLLVENLLLALALRY